MTSSRDKKSVEFLNSDAINDDFFIDIVERKLKITRDKFKLRLVFIEPATGKNENYASVVYRARINVEIYENDNNGKREFVNVIIKAMLSNMLEGFSIFEREIVIYENVISNFENLWRDVAREEIEFGPKCLKIESKPYEIIVLDDLKTSGYEMLDRKIGLDLQQTKLFLDKLAKFHAASAICYRKDGYLSPLLDRLAMMQDPKFNNPEEQAKHNQIFGSLMEMFKEVVAKLPNCEKISQKIQQIDTTKVMTTFISMIEPMRNGFQCLSHGDGWLNNMMFKLNADGDFIDCKMLDFQLSYWGSPASDLIYMLISSVADDVKVAHFDELIEFYHEVLVESLTKLNYEHQIPTLCELHVDLLDKGALVGMHMMLVMFVAKYESNEELNLEGLMDPTKFDPNAIRVAFQGKPYLKALETWLPFLNRRGFLDTMLPQHPPTQFMANFMQQMEEQQKMAQQQKSKSEE